MNSSVLKATLPKILRPNSHHLDDCVTEFNIAVRVVIANVINQSSPSLQRYIAREASTRRRRGVRARRPLPTPDVRHASVVSDTNDRRDSGRK